LLLVDDESYLLPPLSALLADDFEVHTADCAEAAQALFTDHRIDIVLTDQKMPRTSGVQLLEWVRRHSPPTVRLLMTGYAEYEDAVEAINRGHVYYYLIKPWRLEELRHILRNAAEKCLLERSQNALLEKLQQLNQELEQRVGDRTSELQQANLLLTQRTLELEEVNRQLEQRSQDLEKLALTDPLTGLLNRRAIDDVAAAELRRRARYHSPLALGIIDVDHFKCINDKHLLPGGDFVLVSLTRTLSGLLRTVDSIGRIGGEEFLVVAPETTSEGAVVMAERIRTTVESTSFQYDMATIPVTISLGFAVAGAGVPAKFDQMKYIASAAMREAKRRGRNCAVVRSLPTPKEPDKQLILSTGA
jgi:diguanylate cyclase (GGDEF)-like protein